MTEQQEIPAAGSDWSLIGKLLEIVRTDPEARRIMQTGTREERLALLQERLGVTQQDLERMHAELQEATGNSELDWWAW